MNRYDGVFLNLLPVCECGEILRDAYACKCIGDVENGIKYMFAYIEPACCPFCGQTIRGFNIQHEYLDMFGGE